jgi:lipopolysaccharide biosynthesis glycosyltransferase/Tfp pilus assembly protein PilF
MVGSTMQSPGESLANEGGSSTADPWELVRLGHQARDRRDFITALRMFEAASDATSDNLNILVECGSTLRAMSRFDAAEATYRGVLERAPGHFGALVGLGHLAKQQGDRGAALEYFEAAAETDLRNPNLQAEIAHTLVEMGRAGEAELAYQNALEGSPRHFGALVGLGHIARRRGDRDAALVRFEAASNVDAGNVSVEIEIADLLREMRRLDHAERRYRGVLEASPGHLGALLGLAQIARERGDDVAALQWFEAALESDASRLPIRLEIVTTLRQLGRLDEAEAVCRRVLEQRPDHAEALISLGHIARARGDCVQALTHFQAAQAAEPGNLRAPLEVARVLRELQRPDDAEAMLRQLESLADAGIDAELLRECKFEHFCLTRELNKAADCLAGWTTARQIPFGVLSLVAGFHASRREWRALLDLFRDGVREGGWDGRIGRHTALMEAIAEAARRTGRYQEVMDLVDCLLDAGRDAALVGLRDHLAEELRLLDVLALRTAPPANGQVIHSPFRTWRTEFMSALLADRQPPRSARTIYLCTDATFLPGAVVSVASLLRNNVGALPNYTLIVFCSDEIADFGATIFGELAAAFSVRIDVRASSTLLTDQNLTTEYGFFTAGHALSEAAYHRIYAAVQLLNEGFDGRALYLDADTCIGPCLERLLEFDLNGLPLAARCDLPGESGVRQAALKLGISPETYFNSGVLLFDMGHPALCSALKTAINMSSTRPQALTFHDQCALNAAFHGNVCALPEQFNTFIKPDTVIGSSSVAQIPVVTHFLGRPKPWDPAYAAANCVVWLEGLAMLGTILQPARLRQMLAMQFPQPMGS